jgi:hypothetical protein
MQIIPLIVCFLFGCCFSVMAQKVSVYNVSEQRSTANGSFNNRCVIELRISGDEVRKYKLAKISAITKATDDQDLDLLNEDPEDFEYEEIEEDAIVSLETKIPSRKAAVIKDLTGVIHLYSPTEANGGIIKVSDYQSKANTNLLPDAAGVKVVYLTKASMEQYTKDQKSKKEAELNKLSGVAKEMAELLLQAFEGLSDFGDDPNQAMFILDGDQDKVVDIYFEDAAGKKIDRNGYTKSGNMVVYYFEEQPDPKWKLVMNIESSGSIKKVPFALVNIDLP